MSELAGVLDELVVGAPIDALSWSDVEARSEGRGHAALRQQMKEVAG